MERIWNESQLKNFDLPQEVADSIKKTLSILDAHYGADRNVDTDDGGFVVLINHYDSEVRDREYKEIITKYKLIDDEPEYEEIICQYDDKVWYCDLYILSSDYAITVVYFDYKGDL